MNHSEKNYSKLIWFLSIFIPVAVALLFNVKIDGYDFSFLPPIYASINFITAFVLVFAVYHIKKGNRETHEKLMKFAIILSCLFLVMYIVYHATSDATKFGDANFDGEISDSEKNQIKNIAYFYYTILVSHIVLSIAIIPLVLISFSNALSKRFDKHKKIAKITFPIWLYVAISGVVVYLMISPYYG